MTTIALPLRPALAPGVRLQTDHVTGEPVLLSPETVVVLNPTAHEIVACCDGKTSVGEIVATLAQQYDAPEETLREDVVASLAELCEKHLIVVL